MRRGRSAKACVACRTTKTRCSYSQDPKTCDKCLSRGIVCMSYQGPLGSRGAQPPEVNADAVRQRASSASAVPSNNGSGGGSQGPAPMTANNSSVMVGGTPQGGANNTHMSPEPLAKTTSTPTPPNPKLERLDANISEIFEAIHPVSSHSSSAASFSPSTSITSPTGPPTNVYPPLNTSVSGPAPAPSGIPEDFANLGVIPEAGFPMEDPALSNSENFVSLLSVNYQPLISEHASSRHRFRYQESLSFGALSILQDKSGFGQYSRMWRSTTGSLPRGPVRSTLISEGVLGRDEVIGLFGSFRENYNHWVSLSDTLDTNALVDYLLGQCSLLVTTCCCVSLRFGPTDVWNTVYPRLVAFLWRELAASAIETPQTIEFLQALTILSKFADSLSYEDYVFDMWLLSGMGLQHLETVASAYGPFSHLHLRLYNHLYLAHVTAANFTGRRSIVDREPGLALSHRILNEPLSTKFDSCMVAELSVQSLAHEFFRFHIDLAEFDLQAASWWDEWRFLAQKPLIQFLEPVYLYTRFTVKAVAAFRAQGASADFDSSAQNLLDIAINSFSTPSLCNDLAALGKVMEALLEVVHESFFSCLSDPLHHMGFNSGVMAMTITHTLRLRSPCMGMSTMSVVINLVQRLAMRFTNTSYGRQDISAKRGQALLDLGQQLGFFQ